MPHILNVTVPIPETHVLITKDEYEELIAYSLDPVWNMSDLKKKLKIASDETIKDRLLFHPRLEKELRAQVSYIILMRILIVGGLTQEGCISL